MDSKAYTKAFGKLKRYAKDLGLEIYFSDTFAYCPSEQIILLDSKYKNKKECIIYLLHELGHATQNDSYFHNIKSKTLNIKRCIILEQEYTAWVNGYHIADELSLMNETFNKDYLIEWVSAWQEYAEWLYKTDIKTLNNSFKGYMPEGRPPIG